MCSKTAVLVYPRPAHAAAATATNADITKRGCGRDGAKPKTKLVRVNATVYAQQRHRMTAASTPPPSRF
ncbi:hypothetical protein BHM03_00041443 [Ensete ventricosum]|nr:hypothetical protein BHM03_00041443 [Ensete ventricosum]